MKSETELAQLRLECLRLAGGDRVKAAGHVKFVLGGDSAPEIDLTGFLGGSAERLDGFTMTPGGGWRSPSQKFRDEVNSVIDEIRRIDPSPPTDPTVAIPVEPSDDDVEAMAEAASNTDRASCDIARWNAWRQKVVRAHLALVARHR